MLENVGDGMGGKVPSMPHYKYVFPLLPIGPASENGYWPSGKPCIIIEHQNLD